MPQPATSNLETTPLALAIAVIIACFIVAITALPIGLSGGNINNEVATIGFVFLAVGCGCCLLVCCCTALNKIIESDCHIINRTIERFRNLNRRRNQTEDSPTIESEQVTEIVTEPAIVSPLPPAQLNLIRPFASIMPLHPIGNMYYYNQQPLRGVAQVYSHNAYPMALIEPDENMFRFV